MIQAKWYCEDDFGKNEEIREDDWHEITGYYDRIEDEWHFINLAESIAEKDYDYSGGELGDPRYWPRTYVININGKVKRAVVDLEYSPNFICSMEENENE